jgi:hypothetical protein
VTKRFPVRGLGADVAYGGGFIWVITDEPAAGGGQDYLTKIDPSRNLTVKAAPIPGPGPACAGFPGPQGIWIGCAGGDRITLMDQGSLKPAGSLRVDSGGYTPQIVPGPNAVWVLTPSGLARADPATATITAVIHTGYAPSALSAPALVMDSAGRLWITGSQLAVAVPDTLTAYPVAHTPDMIAAAADGPAIWVDTGSTLVKLQADTGTPGPCSEVCSGSGYGLRQPAVDSVSPPSRRSKSGTARTPATCGTLPAEDRSRRSGSATSGFVATPPGTAGQAPAGLRTGRISPHSRVAPGRQEGTSDARTDTGFKPAPPHNPPGCRQDDRGACPGKPRTG